MKLELKHITPYLPYQLMVLNIQVDKLMRLSSVSSLGFINEKDYQFGVSPFGVDTIKPILRPLSSMTKDEAYELINIVISDDKIKNINIKNEDSLVAVSSQREHGLYVLYIDSKNRSVEVYYEDYSCIAPNYPISYEIYEWLFSKHFDVFNLIENNLAIDKTKI